MIIPFTDPMLPYYKSCVGFKKVSTKTGYLVSKAWKKQVDFEYKLLCKIARIDL